jgi:hypothetical protein
VRAIEKISIFLVFLLFFSGKNTPTYPVVYVLGDSVTEGYDANLQAGYTLKWGYAYQLGNFYPCTPSVLGVSGQPLSQGLAGCFNFSNIPTKVNSTDKLIFAWGINDCWKSTFTKLDSAYRAVISAAHNSHGWAFSDIYVLSFFTAGYRTLFTKAHWDSTVTYCIQPAANSLGVHIIDERANFQSLGGISLTVDSVHKTLQGHTYTAILVSRSL